MQDSAIVRLQKSIEFEFIYREALDDNIFKKPPEKTHDWKNHIPKVIEELWSELSYSERVLIIAIAIVPANNEEWD